MSPLAALSNFRKFEAVRLRMIQCRTSIKNAFSENYKFFLKKPWSSTHSYFQEFGSEFRQSRVDIFLANKKTFATFVSEKIAHK